MSYADVAASGPTQTAEEPVAAAMAEERVSPKHKLITVDSRAPAVPEIERSTSEETQSLIDVDGPHLSSVPSDFEVRSIQTDTQAERLEREQEDRERIRAARSRSSKSSSKSSKAAQTTNDPIALGNIVVVGAVGAVLGTSAWRRWNSGENISWSTVGLWTGIVGAFAVGDYFVTRWLYRNYPGRK